MNFYKNWSNIVLGTGAFTAVVAAAAANSAVVSGKEFYVLIDFCFWLDTVWSFMI